MPDGSSTFDVADGHRRFSADCFNRTWTLIEKPDRTAAEDEQMILCAQASLWHWTQRSDCTGKNLSIGYWQVSRVFALIGQGDNAMRYARRCLEVSANGSPFLIGYAHEAIARAAMVLGDRGTCSAHLQQAGEYAAAVAEDSDRTALQNDLKELQDR